MIKQKRLTPVDTVGISSRSHHVTDQVVMADETTVLKT